MASFKEIGLRCGTDKITHHGYDRFYPRFLEDIRGTTDAVLEIGIETQASLNMWLDYFPNAFVYGIDIKMELDGARARVFRGDQSSTADLHAIHDQISHPIRFIIDDGSHIPEHQLSTFEYFFSQLLEPGGVYIIEDIETSYWARENIYGYATNYGYMHPASLIERVKPLVDTINREFLTPAAADNMVTRTSGFSNATRDMISTMTFGQNCVIFTKKTVAEMAYLNRPYRFPSKL